MRRTRMVAVAGAVALATSTLGTTAASAQAPAGAQADGKARSYVVLAEKGGDAKALAKQLAKAGADVTSVNSAVGMVTVTSTDADFAAGARSMKGVEAAATNAVVGRAPGNISDRKAVESLRPEGAGQAASPNAGKKLKKDPLDEYLWGMEMIDAFEAHQVDMGSKRVRVGVMDTGIDGSHP